MAFEAGATYATLGVDLDGLSKGFDQGERAANTWAKGVENRVEKVGGSFSKIGSLASGILTGVGFGVAAAGFAVVGRAAAGTFDLIKGGMDDARGAGMLLAQTENVIEGMGNAAGVSAEHVNDFASSLSDAAGGSLFGDDMIVESTNLLLTFGNLKEGVLDAATAMSVDMAQSLGGAPVDSAIQLGKALNDPIKGVSALARVGVSFTEQQKEQIKTLQESGDMVGAQTIILGELERQFGGSAAAAAAAAGPMVRLRGVMGEAAETVGAALLPALDSFTGWLGSPAVLSGINSFASNLANGISGAIGFINGTAIPAVMGFIDGLRGGFEDNGIEGAIQSVIFQIGQLIPGLLPVTNFLRDLLPQAVSMATTTFNLARDSILTFIAAYNGEWQNSDRVLLIHQAFGVLGQVIGGTVVPAIQSMVGWFQQNWDLVTKIGVAVGVAVAVFQTLSTVVGVVGTVTAAISGMGGAITAAGGIVATIVAVLGGPLTIALAAVALAAGALALAWQTNFGGIQEKTQAVVNWWTDTAQPAIAATFDRVVEQVGIMRDAWDRDFESVRGFINTLKETWASTTAAIGVAIDLAKGYVSSFRDTVQTNIDQAVGFFTALPGRITGAVSGFASLLVSAGRDLIQGLINGLKSIDVGSVLGGILRSGIAAAKAAILSHSPSRLTEIELGIPIVQGIVRGIEGETPDLMQHMTRLGQLTPEWFTGGFNNRRRLLKTAGETIAKDIVGGFVDSKPLLQDGMVDTSKLTLENLLKAITPIALDAGEQVADSFYGGFVTRIPMSTDTLVDTSKLTLENLLRSITPIASDAGEQVADAFVGGFVDSKPLIEDAIIDTSKLTLDNLLKAVSPVAFGAGANIMDHISGGLFGGKKTLDPATFGQVSQATGAAGMEAGQALIDNLSNAWVEGQPAFADIFEEGLVRLRGERLDPWLDGTEERFLLSGGWMAGNLGDGLLGNRAPIDAASSLGRGMAAALAAAWGPPVLPPPVVSGSPVPDSVASGAGQTGSNRGQQPIIIQQTFGPGTPMEVRQAARQGGLEGVQAAARSKGLL